jgi:hypothetical protein
MTTAQAPSVNDQLRAVNAHINKSLEIAGTVGLIIEIVGGVMIAAALVSALRSGVTK